MAAVEHGRDARSVKNAVPARLAAAMWPRRLRLGVGGEAVMASRPYRSESIRHRAEIDEVARWSRPENHRRELTRPGEPVDRILLDRPRLWPRDGDLPAVILGISPAWC